MQSFLEPQAPYGREEREETAMHVILMIDKTDNDEEKSRKHLPKTSPCHANCTLQMYVERSPFRRKSALVARYIRLNDFKTIFPPRSV